MNFQVNVGTNNPITVVTLSLIVSIIYIVGYWKLFTKAGEQGWKGLIPIYNEYVLWKIGLSKRRFFKYLILSVVGIIALVTGVSISSLGAVLLGVVVLLLSLLPYAGFCFELARVFGHSKLFALGLFLFNDLFILILAFDKSKYLEEIYDEAIVPVSMLSDTDDAEATECIDNTDELVSVNETKESNVE